MHATCSTESTSFHVAPLFWRDLAPLRYGLAHRLALRKTARLLRHQLQLHHALSLCLHLRLLHESTRSVLPCVSALRVRGLYVITHVAQRQPFFYAEFNLLSLALDLDIHTY